jgi:universal stress protein E
LFRNILCPIAFDVNSLRALRVTRQLAAETDGRIYLLQVALWMVPAVRPASAQLMMEAKAAAEKRLNDLAADRLGARVKYQTALVLGADPDAEIIRAVSDSGADLVVMPTQRRIGLSRLVLGSVAEKVVREGPCPF